jgi:hypothetical protein
VRRCLCRRISSSRRTRLGKYLIPWEAWPGLRAEVCREIQAPEVGTHRLCEREKELNGLLDRVEALIADGRDVGMESDDLVASPDASLTEAAGCSRAR